MGLQNKSSSNSWLRPVFIVVAWNKVDFPTMDASTDRCSIGCRYLEREVSENVQLVFLLNLLVDVFDEGIVHLVDVAKGPVREAQYAFVTKMGIGSEPNHRGISLWF